MLRWAGISCALAACYNPQAPQECTVSCTTPGATGECPNGQTCGSDLRCFSTAPCAAPVVDAGPDDGNHQACPGHWLFKSCLPSNATTLTLVGSVDTTNDSRCVDTPQTFGPNVCMMFGAGDVMVPNLNLAGTRPLVIVAER